MKLKKLTVILTFTFAISIISQGYAATEPNTDTMVFLASDLPVKFKNSIKPEIAKLLTNSEPDDVIHLIETPSHTSLASIRVPAGNVRTRLRKPEVRVAMQKIGKFLKRRPERMEGVLNGQIEVPAIGSTIQSLRRNTGKVNIVLVGNPVYDNRDNNVWSMKDGRVPSDAAISSSICPFGCTGELPEGTEVKWLTQTASWGKNEKHRRAVTRFYQLYFQKYDSKLTRLSTEPVVAFGKPSTADDSLDLRPAVSDGDDFVGMKELVAKVVPVEIQSRSLVQKQVSQEKLEQPEPAVKAERPAGGQESRVEQTSPSVEQPEPPVGRREIRRTSTEPAVKTTADVENLIQSVAANPRKIFVAINWISGGSGSDCDVDLWIGNDGHADEIYFQRKNTSFGKLYRDIRRSGTIDGSSEQFRSWECAEIFHNRLDDLTIWLNAYQTDRPIKVRVIIVWKGIRKEKVMEIKTTRGDGARNHYRRADHRAWLKVNTPF